MFVNKNKQTTTIQTQHNKTGLQQQQQQLTTKDNQTNTRGATPEEHHVQVKLPAARGLGRGQGGGA